MKRLHKDVKMSNNLNNEMYLLLLIKIAEKLNNKGELKNG